MTGKLLPKKVLSTDWNNSPEKIFGWKRAEAVAIVFRSLAECNPSTGANAARGLSAGVNAGASVSPVNGRVLRVLMVEDCDNDCELICYQLKKGGYTPRVERVFCAETMRAALEREQWDIVFTDHGLPGFSGPEAITLLRKLGLQIPVICITGSIDPVVIRKILAAGVRACISKDDLSLLCMAVERALNGSSTREFDKQYSPKNEGGFSGRNLETPGKESPNG